MNLRKKMTYLKLVQVVSFCSHLSSLPKFSAQLSGTTKHRYKCWANYTSGFMTTSSLSFVGFCPLKAIWKDHQNLKGQIKQQWKSQLHWPQFRANSKQRADNLFHLRPIDILQDSLFARGFPCFPLGYKNSNMSLIFFKKSILYISCRGHLLQMLYVCLHT